MTQIFKAFPASLILLNANNCVPRIRITPRPVILVALLIRPASDTDNAEFDDATKTYSKVFKVVGNLLQDHLTKLKSF